MNARSFLLSAGAWFAVVLAVPLPAQTPTIVMFFKTLSVTQTSASSQES